MPGQLIELDVEYIGAAGSALRFVGRISGKIVRDALDQPPLGGSPTYRRADTK